MKVNYVLFYGIPYLKYKYFDTFEKMSEYIVKKGIVNYTIFEKMEDKKEVEMIYRDNDIRVLKDRINKAIEFIKENANYTGIDFVSDLRYDECLELLRILKGEKND